MFKRLLLAGAALALATGTAAAKDLKSIGISVGSLGNVYFVTLAKGAEATAKTINPNVKVTVADLAITHISGQRRGGCSSARRRPTASSGTTRGSGTGWPGSAAAPAWSPGPCAWSRPRSRSSPASRTTAGSTNSYLC